MSLFVIKTNSRCDFVPRFFRDRRKNRSPTLSLIAQYLWSFGLSCYKLVGTSFDDDFTTEHVLDDIGLWELIAAIHTADQSRATPNSHTAEMLQTGFTNCQSIFQQYFTLDRHDNRQLLTSSVGSQPLICLSKSVLQLTDRQAWRHI